ncbi:hypothetical protein [Hydrogenophaga sp.]|uniref:hypothetical protein n=1 Tax=Hydrogenophaga sp. TaxID=1904254 RepID=UPI0019BD1498|nr:hypothetical protein [Hydrogenophaga sp.]MBD3893550.1 hypothetical protein [Hydrogenophaga sp.]
MPANGAETFRREMGCSEAEWLRCLPAAIGEHAWQQAGASARVEFPDGHLQLQWQPLAPRCMALLRLPVLQVDFSFQGLDAAQQAAFMRRFDLYVQRGGG